MAELLSSHPIIDPRYEDCGEVIAGRIDTSHGVVSYLSMGDRDAGKEYFVNGGLGSGCEYFYPARAIVRAGLGRVTMLRHSSVGASPGTILDKDADEVAETIMVLNKRGAPISLVNHSKGTKVGLLTVPKLPDSLDVQEVLEFNPVIGTSLNRGNIMRRARSLPQVLVESMYSTVRHPMRMRRSQHGTQWEMFNRAGPILSESYALILAGKDIRKPDLEAVRNRKNIGRTLIIAAYGSKDKITQATDIERGIEEHGLDFDATIKLDQKGFRGHLDLISNPAVVLAITSFSGVMLKAVRTSDREQVLEAEVDLYEELPEEVKTVEVDLKLPAQRTRKSKSVRKIAA
ncbi:MAG: hypothetical protein M3Q14_00235 [bacterium]|nr:hypothetical protein [bacterium]